MNGPSMQDRQDDEKSSHEAYSLHGDEIETMYDDYIMKLKMAVKVLKERAGTNEMRPMDHDNPLDSPGGYDI